MYTTPATHIRHTVQHAQHACQWYAHTLHTCAHTAHANTYGDGAVATGVGAASRFANMLPCMHTTPATHKQRSVSHLQHTPPTHSPYTPLFRSSGHASTYGHATLAASVAAACRFTG